MERKRCILCGRRATSVLCSYHREAYENLLVGYREWCRRLGRISLEEYLERILLNPNTGVWVKEIVKAVLKGSVKLDLSNG